ncbi:hypothetical protein CAPTEDRAFT_218301 [Capitella teleta]|uniref:Endonuclease/exonuclease/phosphatase domain-containing protein n=1 Tax=Capitella teleta TaxID=283909 RepID=R7TXD4_CAPTE|nr:hypothetical protein CAPTEDRAFT_218301 [Capitella teleta]|eukprot:ELT98593.1 hypothetical protein CAPTEDRAFT_218301 [Capitella teleta]
MPDDEIHVGRPYGGCCIIWNSKLKCKVSPLPCGNSRVCAIKIDLSDGPLLLINAYMPCDTQVAYHDNQLVFEEVLNDVADLIQISNIDRIVFGGDFNTELSRRASTHTRSLNQFVTNESLSFLSALSCYEVDYTHESDAHGTRSTLDHFIVSSQLVCSVNRVQCDHNALSSSDHTALLLSLSISMPSITNGQSVPRRGPVPLWPKATDAHIANYRNSLSESTEDLTLPYEALRCDSPQCTAHTETILSYYNALISLCLSSGRRSIPHSPVSRSGSRRSVPFWSTHVRPLKDSALFWHAIWKSCDSPTTGAVANIRRSTRAKYHRAIRYFKQNDQLARFTRMGEYFVNQGRDDFWTEVQKMRGNNSATPTIVDDCLSEDDIALCFREKYNTLYNSVGYVPEEMARLRQEIEANAYTKQNVEYFANLCACRLSKKRKYKLGAVISFFIDLIMIIIKLKSKRIEIINLQKYN